MKYTTQMKIHIGEMIVMRPGWEESKCWCFAVTGEERDGSPTVREGLPLLRGSLILRSHCYKTATKDGPKIIF